MLYPDEAKRAKFQINALNATLCQEVNEEHILEIWKEYVLKENDKNEKDDNELKYINIKK